jgi:hypothetical protein
MHATLNLVEAMSPELMKETIVACVGVVCSAVFAAIPATILVWWTWQRDQERLIVQKSPLRVNDLYGKPVILKNTYNTPQLRVLIRNRSLFPVRVSAVGFDIDGTIYELTKPSVWTKAQKSAFPLPPSDDDVIEIPSGAYTFIEFTQNWDSAQVGETLEKAATKQKMSVDALIFSKRVSALVVLETGKRFASGSRIWRLYLSVGRSINGWWQRITPARRNAEV